MKKEEDRLESGTAIEDLKVDKITLGFEKCKNCGKSKEEHFRNWLPPRKTFFCTPIWKFWDLTKFEAEK